MQQLKEAVFLALLTGAGIGDLKNRRIPNALIQAGAGLGVVLFFQMEGFWGAAGFVGRGVLGLTLGLVLFLTGAAGGGDGKLIALILAWQGISQGFRCVFAGLLLAGVWSLKRLCSGRQKGKRIAGFQACLRQLWYRGRLERTGREVVPLGLCIWLGTVLDQILKSI